VTHTAELLYVYGFEPFIGRPASAVALGARMMDYWLSFATSLDPNDRLGSDRMSLFFLIVHLDSTDLGSARPVVVTVHSEQRGMSGFTCTMRILKNSGFT
jgi:hypothetical protein